MNSSTQIATRNIYSFHGGVHPEEHKHHSNGLPITKAPLPPYLILPLQQHIGAPAKILVGIGQTVLKGECLAEPQGMISAAIHAPTSGKIIDICQHALPHASGMSDLCVILEPDGEDRWCELSPSEDYSQLSHSEIQAKVRQAGIVGMGGAGFPTEVKLHPPRHDKVATLILNAAECEPYITADDRLMRERASDIVQGMEIMSYILEPGECLIGIEDNKPEAIAALNKAAQGTRIEVVVVPTKYPSGGEKQLIKLLTDKEVPSGKIPADVGVVCQNVGTAAAVYRAVRFGEPLISRVTTLTGEQIAQPRNVEVLLGTPIDWLLKEYGYTPSKPERVIMGGPMMGFALPELALPIVKTTNCLLAPSLSELPLQQFAQACIRCGQCADACPAELLPQQLYWFARGKEYDKAQHHNLFDCIECGACSYVCPSAIPLVQYYRHAKGEIRQQQAEQQKAEQAKIRFEARQDRLAREVAEKEAKKKARAEAAAKAQAAKKAAAEAAAKAQAEGANSEGASTQAESPASSVDSKQAAIQAALARKQAQTAKPSEPVDLDKLKEAWDKAQAKLDAMHDSLEQAKQDNPEQVDKLTRAIAKNQLRANQAKLAYDNALKQAQDAPELNSSATATSAPAANAPAVDLDKLEDKVNRAEDKLAKIQTSIDEADPEDPDKLALFKKAYDKQKERVEQAKTALEDAKASAATTSAINTTATPEAPPVKAEQAVSLPPVDLDKLEDKLNRAEEKLEKIQASIDEADPEDPDKLALFKKAYDKQKERVEQAKAALNAAKAPEAATVPATEAARETVAEAPQAKPAVPVSLPPLDLDKLEDKVNRAEEKLEKIQASIDEADPEDPDKLALFKKAYDKQKERVEQAKVALNAAKAPAAEQAPAAVEDLAAEAPPVKPTVPVSLPPLDLDKLEDKVNRAEDKLQKIQASIDEADPEDSDKLALFKKAYDKQKDRLEQARAALEQAQTEAQ